MTGAVAVPAATNSALPCSNRAASSRRWPPGAPAPPGPGPGLLGRCSRCRSRITPGRPLVALIQHAGCGGGPGLLGGARRRLALAAAAAHGNGQEPIGAVGRRGLPLQDPLLPTTTAAAARRRTNATPPFTSAAASCGGMPLAASPSPGRVHTSCPQRMHHRHRRSADLMNARMRRPLALPPFPACSAGSWGVDIGGEKKSGMNRGVQQASGEDEQVISVGWRRGPPRAGGGRCQGGASGGPPPPLGAAW